MSMNAIAARRRSKRATLISSAGPSGMNAALRSMECPLRVLSAMILSMHGGIGHFERAALRSRWRERQHMSQETLRHYVVLKTNAEVASQYFSPDRAEADAWAASYVAQH